MEKELLTKKQAEALMELEQAGWTPTMILERHQDVLTPFGYHRARKIISQMPIITLATALVNGWEIEPTPHEKLAEAYKEPPLTDESMEWQTHYYRKGIEAALFILNIKVKGINE